MSVLPHMKLKLQGHWTSKSTTQTLRKTLRSSQHEMYVSDYLQEKWKSQARCRVHA